MARQSKILCSLNIVYFLYRPLLDQIAMDWNNPKAGDFYVSMAYIYTNHHTLLKQANDEFIQVDNDVNCHFLIKDFF